MARLQKLKKPTKALHFVQALNGDRGLHAGGCMSIHLQHMAKVFAAS